MTRTSGRLLAGALVLMLSVSGGLAPSSAGAADDVPPRSEWIKDVRAAMAGSGTYVRDRVASAQQAAEEAGEPGPKLAINFDIDNTVLATYYDGGGAIPRMLRFANMAHAHGVALMFNTGRLRAIRARTREQLIAAGYPVTALCLRRKGEALAAGKQRCRQRFVDNGFTIIANIGNRETDFVGGNYERAFQLPNYGGVLG